MMNPFRQSEIIADSILQHDSIFIKNEFLPEKDATKCTPIINSKDYIRIIDIARKKLPKQAASGLNVSWVDFKNPSDCSLLTATRVNDDPEASGCITGNFTLHRVYLAVRVRNGNGRHRKICATHFLIPGCMFHVIRFSGLCFSIRVGFFDKV
jgi:hypothetical protein